MVRCGKISIDGTKIEANSSRYKLTYRKKLEKSRTRHEEKVEEILYDVAARRKGDYRCSKNKGYEKLKLKMLDFLETEEGKQLLNRRKHDVEPVLGDIKYNISFRKFLLRLMPKVSVETGFVSIAHNIKKIKSWLEIQNMVSGNA